MSASKTFALMLLLPIFAQAENLRPISFRRDVMPVFMRAGCNTGGCHGSARGQDGFHLSLFGYDPEGDYHRLTREMSGRRLNFGLPEESLLLQKATGAVAHTGGKRFDRASALYKTLLAWIEARAPNDPPDTPQVTRLEVQPQEILLEGENATRQLSARAFYSDGTSRDVTSLAVFLSNNEGSAKVSAEGLVTSAARGEAFITARFDTITVGTAVIVAPHDPGFAFPALGERNYIDTLNDAKLRKLRVAPSAPCSDQEFLRRAFIDLAGRLPSAEEFTAFTGSKDGKRREKLIDTLLAREEFTDLWVMKWAELLQIRSSEEVSYKSALLYYEWLREKLKANTPVNVIARELIASTGGTFANPAASYYQTETDPLKLAEDTAQSFLGVQLKCAQCHNHPFDRWTMNDYRGFVGFFTQVARKKAEDPRETIVFNRGSGESKHPVTGRDVAPKFLGGSQPEVKGMDRRAVLADWIAAPDNPWFARHMANLVWAHFFGRGIVDPVDDVRISNPPSNAALLDALAEKFVASNYDLRQLVREICNSRTYQASSLSNATNETDSRNFSHSAIRRLRAEVMLDCISQVTGTTDKFPAVPRGARAVQIPDGQTSSYFLKTFGRATRETPCSCEVSMEPNLSQALHLLNGDTVSKKIREGGVIKALLDAGKTPAEVLGELYLRCFSRQPNQEEQQNLVPVVESAKDRRQACEDVFWALLNSKEFLFNH
jgi:hypothetical protein